MESALDSPFGARHTMPIEYSHLDRMAGQQADRFPVPPVCPRCSYELTGLTVQRCPECGRRFKISEVRQQSVRTWSAIRRLRHANADARTGLKLAAGAWAAVLVFQLPGLRHMLLAVNLAALAAALFAAVLGFGVFQVYRVPPTARRLIEKPPPRLLLGVATLILSLMTVLTVLLTAI